MGKYDEAIASYEQILAITPNDIDALYNIGLSLDSQGKHDKATFYYNKILAIDPANVDALNKMHLTYNNANKTEISVFQQIDQTSLYVVVGLGITLVATIVVINLVAKRSHKKRGPEASDTSVVPKMEKEESTRMEIKEDDEWKGI